MTAFKSADNYCTSTRYCAIVLEIRNMHTHTHTHTHTQVQGTAVGLRSTRSMPSRNPVSTESQASSRKNIEPSISTLVYASKSDTTDDSTFLTLFHPRMLPP